VRPEQDDETHGRSPVELLPQHAVHALGNVYAGHEINRATLLLNNEMAVLERDFLVS
jgi:hypothetical protein